MTSRRHPIAVNPTMPRTINTTVEPAVHDIFDGEAAKRNIGKGPLLRLMVEAVARDPGKLEALLQPSVGYP